MQGLGPEGVGLGLTALLESSLNPNVNKKPGSLAS